MFRVFWAAAVTFAATFGILKGLDIWEHYQTRATVTSLEINYVDWNVPFPSITVCQKRFREDTNPNVSAIFNELMA